MIIYKLQPIPNGYRIVQSNGINYTPIFETYPSLDEDILNQIITALEKSYQDGYRNGCGVYLKED